MADERTAELRGLTLGVGTNYPFAKAWIRGLGIPQIRTADQPRGALAGDVGGDDVPQKRVLTISVGLQGDWLADDLGDGTSASEAAFRLLDALKTAWAPSPVNLPLTITVGDYWTRVFRGRPRGVDEDLSEFCPGVFRALLTFEALEVYAEGETVTAGFGAGLFGGGTFGD